MTNYTKTTNFATKDTLPSGNANKIVKGTEIDTEFNNIATAVATKADTAGPTFTGTVTIPTVDLNGGAIDGTTVGASTAAAITGTTIVANTSINIAGDGATVTGIKDEDDMSSNSATKLATQQSIKAYVDSQVTAQDLDFQADTGGALSIDLDSETLTFTGGTGVDTSGSGNAVTFAIDSTVATLTGSQTLSNKTLATPVVSGNLTTNGLIDGRDVATDGTKLDGIESGATADQTAAEIKTAYESNADTNAFTDADHSKLDGIEASADVTDTANVTAAGALMDSELTDIAAVKALNQGVATSDSPTFAGLTTSADVSFGDNDKAIFGAGSDLEIFHEPNNSIIKESGGGSLLIQGDNIRLQKVDGTENMLTAVNDGQLKLFYDGSEKLATTSTGIDVTGTATMDGLTVDSGTVDTVATFQSSGDANAYVVVKDSGSSGGAFIGAVGTHTILGTGGSTERMRIDSSGNVGIGRTPRVMLDVAGEAAIAYDATYGLRFYNQDQNNWSSIGNNIATGSSAANLVFKDSTGEVMRLSSGNVGIGTSSPQAAKFSGSAVGILELANTKPVINIHETDVTDAEFFMGMSGGSAVIGTSGNGLMIFQTGTSSTSERMRIDSSGNVLVGTTSDNVANQSGTTQGVRIAGAQNIQVASTGIAAYFNRLSTDGDIVEFRRAGTAVGSIGTTSGNLYIQGNPATGKSGLTFYGSYIEPRDNGAAADAAIDLGISSGRFKDIYRSGSTISTSDRNMKQDIRDLTDAERNVAVAAKGLLKAFRFIDTVAAEGDSANIHFGIIAQDLAAAFEAEGLDANDYQVYRADTFTDDDGNEQTRLGICYENLLAFIIAAI